MAISTRAKGDDSANAFSLARMLVPTNEMSVADRFHAIHQITTEAASGSAANALNAIAAVAGSLPTGITTRLARFQSQTVDFATSNVKGTPQPVFVAGAEILSNFPIGPLGGVAFNLTLLSHVGSLDMGLNMDSRAVAEPSLLTESLEASLADILAVAR
jgi:hypothetical protein